MNIAFYGFSTMDFKGEEINEPYLFKKIADSLNKEHNVYYLYNINGAGINDVDLYKGLDINFPRFPIDLIMSTDFNEYKKYSSEEIYNIYEFNLKLSIKKSKTDIEFELKSEVIKILENLKKIKNDNNIDLFVFWGNSLYSNVIRAFCQKNNIRYVNFENGYFRPFTLMVDSVGVNYESSIPRDRTFYESVEVDYERYDEYLLKPEKSSNEYEEAFKFRKKYYELIGMDITPQDSNQIEKLSSNTETKNMINETNKYIYVPFQLETDSQIIKHSKEVKSMKDLVQFTLQGVKQYNENNPNNKYTIIYKNHPLYMSEYDLIKLPEIEAMVKEYEYAQLLYDGDNQNLVENADIIITNNSTVGFEGLMHEKKVIVLGEAFYDIEGITYSCDDVRKLDSLIENAVNNPVNKNLIHKFIYYLRFEYFSEIFKAAPDENSIKRLVAKILAR